MQQVRRTAARRNKTRVMLCLMKLTLLLSAPVAAQQIMPTHTLTVPPAEVRTPLNFEPPKNLMEPVEVPFRPTMDADEYARLKAEAEMANPEGSRLSAQSGPISPSPSSSVTVNVNVEGLNQTESGGTNPPDLHGAIGRTQYVQVVNSRLVVFDRTTRVRVRSVTLNTFFGSTSFSSLIQPRVLYDRDRGRWIVTARATPESSAVQFFFIAVSRTEDAAGEFFINRINVRTQPFNPNDSFEYPQIGLDGDAVIVTANIFAPSPGGFRGAVLFAIPKNSLYSGQGFTVRLFTELTGTLTPPVVLDTNPASFLIANIPRSPFIALYRLTGSGDPSRTALSVSAVDVGFYSVPRSARQFGTTFTTIDTLDTRFVHVSTQVGDSLFNVHTIDVLGFPTPRWYEINTAGSVVSQRGIVSGAATSDDWNASLAANTDRDVFVTWNSSNQTGSREDPPYFPQIRASGRSRNDPPGVIPPGVIVFQSPTFYEQFSSPNRWGEYSAITFDPLNQRCAVGVNQKVDLPQSPSSTTPWGSRIFLACISE